MNYYVTIQDRILKEYLKVLLKYWQHIKWKSRLKTHRYSMITIIFEKIIKSMYNLLIKYASKW